MRLPSCLLGFALVLAVSAVTPVKRDLTSLKADLATIASQTDALNTAINNFNQSMSITKALANTMDGGIKTLTSGVSQANTNTNSDDTFGIVDSVTVLCNIYQIIPALEAVLQNLIDQQNGFNLLHVLLAPIALLIEADLLALKTATTAFENSMISKTQGVQVPMQSAFDELGTTLDNAISTYSLLGLLT
ncbi:unnamed protein product [Peniophora sp. CBMAI 1063]|nr:unnamed protein product [Peniophora sp. CBMAI 1063]